MAACWLIQYHPRNKTCPCFAIASRGNKNSPRTVLQSTATKIVTKLMNWNQYRVGTLLQRVHTDCLGRKFRPQRSQYTVLSHKQGFKPAIAISLLRLPFQKLLVRGSVLVSVLFLAQKFCAPGSRKKRRFFFSRRSNAAHCSVAARFSILALHYHVLERLRGSLNGTRQARHPLSGLLPPTGLV